MADHGLRPDELDRERRPQVFRRLHILAALLSLTWDEAWQLRRVPLPSRSWRTVVPQSWSPPEPWHEEPRDRRDISVEEHLPQQTQNRWALADTDGSTRHALLAWHQAILVTDAHPSLALIGPTAAVEAAASRLAPGTKGPGRRFEAALGRVANAAEKNQLNRVYQRSNTVHEGGCGHRGAVRRARPGLPRTGQGR
jgi:hypothetical protein